MNSGGRAPSTVGPGGTASGAGPGAAFPAPAPGPGTARIRSQEIDRTELRWRAQALFDDGFRLALVAAQREGPGHRVEYLFTAPRPDRRVELVVRTDPGTGTLPSLALQTFPAGRFERQLYVNHGVLATSGAREVTTGWAPPEREPEQPSGWEARAAGRRLTAVLSRVERLVPNSGVAHALALCLAVEDACGPPVPPPVAATRAVLLELERLQNHLHAIAVMCARGGLAKWAEEAIRLQRTVVDLSVRMSGDRLLHGAVVPGGVHVDVLPNDGELEALASAAAELAYFTLSSFQLTSTYRGRWTVTAHHVKQTGALGFVARASGVDIDARRDHPFHPATTAVTSVTTSAGDALARFEVRIRELETSLRLTRALLPLAETGTVACRPHVSAIPSPGVGLVEGPHGTIVHRVKLAPDGRVASLRVVDPSFLTRSVLTVCRRGPHDDKGSTVESGFDLVSPIT